MNSKNVSVSAAESAELVAGVVNQSVSVRGLQLVAAGAVVVTIEDSDGTNLMGPMSLPANGILVLPPLPHGAHYVQTAAGKGLHILLGGAVQVGGVLQYEIE